MTKAVEILNELRKAERAYKYTKEEVNEAIDQAIKAVEQQPCEDCISRQAAINTVVFECGEWAGLAKEISKQLQQLPPVTPQPKMGRWLHRENMDYLDKNKVVHNHFMCKDCGFIHDFIDGHTAQYKYCPSCGGKDAGGARMTIAQIYEEAKRQLDKGVITIGEFSEIVDREYQEPSKWVPCSEKLPKENDNYFVTISFDIGGEEPVREVYKDFFSASSQKWLYHDEEVIAWMPLPKSYKEGDKKC